MCIGKASEFKKPKKNTVFRQLQESLRNLWMASLLPKCLTGPYRPCVWVLWLQWLRHKLFWLWAIFSAIPWRSETNNQNQKNIYSCMSLYKQRSLRNFYTFSIFFVKSSCALVTREEMVISYRVRNSYFFPGDEKNEFCRHMYSFLNFRLHVQSKKCKKIVKTFRFCLYRLKQE